MRIPSVFPIVLLGLVFSAQPLFAEEIPVQESEMEDAPMVEEDGYELEEGQGLEEAF